MASFEAMYQRRCKSPTLRDKATKSHILGPAMLEHDAERVQHIIKRLLTAQSQQKSYAERRKWNLEFKVGDHMFLRVSLVKGTTWFMYTSTLSP